MLHIWKDKTAISVLDQIFKTFSGLGAYKFWDSYLKFEDCKDTFSQIILKCRDGSISIHFFLFDSDFRGQGKRCKHFRVSNFPFGKNSLGIGAFTLSSV